MEGISEAPEPPSRDEERFRRSLIIGAAAKEIVRAVLESAGYTVYPFGYESSFAVLKQQMAKQGVQHGETAERIRSMPDVLAISPDELHLIEVKFRSRQYEGGIAGVWIENGPVVRCQRYWPDSLLLLVSPHRDRFFARRVNELETSGGPLDATFQSYHEFSLMSNLVPLTRNVNLWPYFPAVDNLTTFLRRRWGRRRRT